MKVRSFSSILSGAMIVIALAALTAFTPQLAAQQYEVGKDDVVHKGEGVEHPLIRQLMANPDLIPSNYVGKLRLTPFTGDRTDKVALKKWAGVQADIFAGGGGYIGSKFHEEFRVSAPDTTAFHIEGSKDGTFSIVMSSVDDGDPTTAQTIVSNPVSDTIAGATFVGPQDGTTVLSAPYSQFGYMFIPS